MTYNFERGEYSLYCVLNPKKEQIYYRN